MRTGSFIFEDHIDDTDAILLVHIAKHNLNFKCPRAWCCHVLLWIQKLCHYVSLQLCLDCVVADDD